MAVNTYPDDYGKGQLLSARDVNTIRDNGVIQVDAVADLSTLPDTVKLAFCLADESVYVNKADSWNKFVGAGANPLGSIMAYGINGNPPAGWQICNGDPAQGPLAAIMDNVPNLINRTVVGIGSGHDYNTVDGTSSHSITVTPTTTDHKHSFSAGNHAHSFSSSHAHSYNHQHKYTRGIYHRHYIRYRNASMTKNAGSNDPYIRFDSTNTSHYTDYVGVTSAYTEAGTTGSTSNGTASGTSGIAGVSGTTGGVTASSNQTFSLDNYPPNLAFHWIIYNGSDV